MLLQNPVIETNPLFNTKPTQLGIGNYSDKIPELSNYLKLIGKRTALGSMIIPSSGAGANELAWEKQNMKNMQSLLEKDSAQSIIDNHINKATTWTPDGMDSRPDAPEEIDLEEWKKRNILSTPIYESNIDDYSTGGNLPEIELPQTTGGEIPEIEIPTNTGFPSIPIEKPEILYNKDLEEEAIEDGLLSEKAPPFYSKITKSIEDAKMNKASGDQWIGMINNSGVNQDELDWIGMKDFLADKKSVTKEEILDFAKMNDLSTEVKEVILGGNNDANKEAIQGFPELSSIGINDDARLVVHNSEVLSNEYNIWYEQNADHQIIKSYNEDLVDEDAVIETFLKEALNFDVSLQNSLSTQHNNSNLITKGDYTDYKEMTFALPNMEESFYMPPQHGYKDRNIFAHARFNTRIIDGQKTLFIEELQSDWVHQGKEKGFKGVPVNAEHAELIKELTSIEETLKKENGENYNADIFFSNSKVKEVMAEIDKIIPKEVNFSTPNLPFKNNWQDVVLKRLVRYAAENGFDAIAMTGSNIQKDRYDLSKHINQVNINGSSKGNGKIQITADNKINEHIYPKDLKNYIGKELAEKILNDLKSNNFLENYNTAVKEFENFSQELSKKYDVPAGANIAMYETIASISKKDIEKYTKLQKAVYEGTNRLEYTGLDLQVGGEGLGEMYDKIFNKSLKKIGKKHNAEVELKELDNKYNMWFMNLTDSLKKQSIEAGMPIAFNKPVNPLLNYA